MTADSARQGLLEEVLGEYMQRLDRGDSVDREQLLARHPELAEELRSYFAASEEVERLGRQARRGSQTEPFLPAAAEEASLPGVRARGVGPGVLGGEKPPNPRPSPNPSVAPDAAEVTEEPPDAEHERQPDRAGGDVGVEPAEPADAQELDDEGDQREEDGGDVEAGLPGHGGVPSVNTGGADRKSTRLNSSH